ncbi:MAG: hypothetical protein ACRC4M_04535 [Mycoplasma sp.]
MKTKNILENTKITGILEYEIIKPFDYQSEHDEPTPETMIAKGEKYDETNFIKVRDTGICLNNDELELKVSTKKIEVISDDSIIEFKGFRKNTETFEKITLKVNSKTNHSSENYFQKKDIKIEIDCNEIDINDHNVIFSFIGDNFNIELRFEKNEYQTFINYIKNGGKKVVEKWTNIVWASSTWSGNCGRHSRPVNLLNDFISGMFIHNDRCRWKSEDIIEGFSHGIVESEVRTFFLNWVNKCQTLSKYQPKEAIDTYNELIQHLENGTLPIWFEKYKK